MTPLYSLVRIDLDYINRTVRRLESEMGSRQFTGEVAEEIRELARRLERLAAPGPAAASPSQFGATAADHVVPPPPIVGIGRAA